MDIFAAAAAAAAAEILSEIYISRSRANRALPALECSRGILQYFTVRYFTVFYRILHRRSLQCYGRGVLYRLPRVRCITVKSTGMSGIY